MKRIIYPIFAILLIILTSECSGYKPIFQSANLDFKITDHTIRGEKILANKIYSKLYNLSNSKKNTQNTRNINILIDVTKDKKPTIKNSSGKILEYKITLNAKIEVYDFLTDVQILNQNFTSSLNYKIQDKYSDTLILENQSMESLLNNTYQNLLIELTQNIVAK